MRGGTKVGLHGVLRRFGIDLVRYTPERFPDLRRSEAIRSREIDLVLDVGAHVGAWARLVRRGGYTGRVISFEPLAAAYAELERAAAADPLWETRRVALSDRDGRSSINVSANPWSSSLLQMAPLHTETSPGSGYVATEEIETVRLDELAVAGSRIFLKLDVQGFELPVLQGATETLARVEALEVELSHAELYAGQALLPELVAYLDAAGLDLVAVEPVHVDQGSGRLLQVDGLFLRRPAS